MGGLPGPRVLRAAATFFSSLRFARGTVDERRRERGGVIFLAFSGVVKRERRWHWRCDGAVLAPGDAYTGAEKFQEVHSLRVFVCSVYR